MVVIYHKRRGWLMSMGINLDLVARLLTEIDRNQSLLRWYDKIGQEGVYGKINITIDLTAAEEALKRRDKAAMNKVYVALKDNK